MSRFCLLFMTLVLAGSLKGNDTIKPLPIPAGLEARVQFWVDVFTKYSIKQRIIHDTEQPERIYKILDFSVLFPDRPVTEEQEIQIIEREMERIVSILRKLSSDTVHVEQLSEEEFRIYRLFGMQPEQKVLFKASSQVHAQNGMREAFWLGILRSECYLDTIRQILRYHELPDEIVYLPHIESSFNPHAHSRDGAVGIWQFTRATGRQYLTIRRGVDERIDPILSTEAAAKHLKTNFKKLGSWPLAVTAYNCGLARIQRAVRKLRTKDLSKIIREYRSRRFGYASKNFYVEFLAAVHVAQNSLNYFEKLRHVPSMRLRTFRFQLECIGDS